MVRNLAHPVSNICILPAEIAASAEQDVNQHFELFVGKIRDGIFRGLTSAENLIHVFVNSG